MLIDRRQLVIFNMEVSIKGSGCTKQTVWCRTRELLSVALELVCSWTICRSLRQYPSLWIAWSRSDWWRINWYCQIGCDLYFWRTYRLEIRLSCGVSAPLRQAMSAVTLDASEYDNNRGRHGDNQGCQSNDYFRWWWHCFWQVTCFEWDNDTKESHGFL